MERHTTHIYIIADPLCDLQRSKPWSVSLENHRTVHVLKMPTPYGIFYCDPFFLKKGSNPLVEICYLLCPTQYDIAKKT